MNAISSSLRSHLKHVVVGAISVARSELCAIRLDPLYSVFVSRHPRMYSPKWFDNHSFSLKKSSLNFSRTLKEKLLCLPQQQLQPPRFVSPRMSHHRPRLRLLAGTLWIASSFLLQTVHGHEHHTDMIAEGEGVSPDPIDGILWAHILLQALAWGILFPTGMVLGVWEILGWIFGRRLLTHFDF